MGFSWFFAWKLREFRGKWRDNCNGRGGTVSEFGDERGCETEKSGNVKPRRFFALRGEG